MADPEFSSDLQQSDNPATSSHLRPKCLSGPDQKLSALHLRLRHLPRGSLNSLQQMTRLNNKGIGHWNGNLTWPAKRPSCQVFTGWQCLGRWPQDPPQALPLHWRRYTTWIPVDQCQVQLPIRKFRYLQLGLIFFQRRRPSPKCPLLDPFRRLCLHLPQPAFIQGTVLNHTCPLMYNLSLRR